MQRILLIFVFVCKYRYLIKTRMDNAGGKSVVYLIDTKLLDSKPGDKGLDSIINLFQKVAAGLV